MRVNLRTVATILSGLAISATSAFAQTKQPPVTPVAATATNAVAATVNGQPLNESMVQRALKGVPADKRAEARTEVLDYLISNMLLDQYLVSQKVVVDPKEVQTKLEEIQKEIKDRKEDYAKMLKEYDLTEDEFKGQLIQELRFDKFAKSRGTDAALKTFFEQNREMFDGSKVRARHILLSPNMADPKAVEAAKANLAAIKTAVNASADAAVAKLPPTTDAKTKEQARMVAIDEAFAKAAETTSVCPSKKQGGDLSYFPRVGSMVEPFAQAAFGLKNYTMSDPVTTQFGLHLILATGRQDGQPVTYEKAKDYVLEVFNGRLRESLSTQLKQTAKIAITPAKG